MVLIDDESATVPVAAAAAAVAFGVSFTDGFFELTDLSIDVSVSSDKPLIFSTAFAKFERLSDDVSLPVKLMGTRDKKNGQKPIKFQKEPN